MSLKLDVHFTQLVADVHFTQLVADLIYIESNSLNRSATDTLTANEALRHTTVRALVDTALTSDQRSFLMGKVLAEDVGLTELLGWAVGKGFDETLTANEAIQFERSRPLKKSIYGRHLFNQNSIG